MSDDNEYLEGERGKDPGQAIADLLREQTEHQRAQQVEQQARFDAMPARHPGQAMYSQVYLMAWEAWLRDNPAPEPTNRVGGCIHNIATMAAEHYKLPRLEGEPDESFGYQCGH